VDPQQSIVQDVKNLGIGAAKGAGSTLWNLGSMNPDPIDAIMNRTQQKPGYLTPQDGAQSLGYGGEQAAEFFAPMGAEEKAVSLLPDALKGVGKIGAQALGSGVVNKAQGGSFGGGALAGGIAGGVGKAGEALAPAIAESALGVRNVDRNFARTPGKAILQDTKGIRPGTIASSAEGKIGDLTSQMEQNAANTGLWGTTQPAVQAVDDAIAKKTGQNSPIVDDLQGLRNQLTVNRSNGLPLSQNQSATGILNLKRGVGDTVGRWPIEQQKGVKGVARQVYGKLDNELDRVAPGSDQLNQRISSLIPVAGRANATDLNASLLQRAAGRFGKHTGAATLAGLGAAEGYHKDGLAGGAAGLAAGAILPEVLSSPTTLMFGARMANSLSQPTARLANGIAAQLFRKRP
jgi:hypothetical protein